MVKFEQPNRELRKRALGDSSGDIPDSCSSRLYHHVAEYVREDVKAVFPLVPKPRKGDWLSEHKESGQRFSSWKGMIRNHVDPKRQTIYLLPIGDFPTHAFLSPDEYRKAVTLKEQVIAPCLELLRQMAETFFVNTKVVLMKGISVDKIQCQSRLNYGVKQLHAGDILKSLGGIAPKDAFCITGITLTDLYPREEWNFVYGLASLQNGTGVFSFARYDPSFYGEAREGTAAEVCARVSRSASRVMIHEIGHMFGLKHCPYFNCLMNGSNHEEEAKRRATFECPICLKKFQSALKFDIKTRYEGLLKMCSENFEFQEDVAWLHKALDLISSLPDEKTCGSSSVTTSASRKGVVAVSLNPQARSRDLAAGGRQRTRALAPRR